MTTRNLAHRWNNKLKEVIQNLICILKGNKIIDLTAFGKISSVLNYLSAFCSIIVCILAIFIYFNIGNINDWSQYVKSKPNSKAAVEEWKKDLSNLRIGFSRNYVEDIIGTPQLTEDIIFNESPYLKTTYTNSYFTLICVYHEDSSLLGFLIIGNDDSFNFQNYRCGFTLFDYTINEAEQYCFEHGVQSYIMLSNFHSDRLDCNSYYFECNYQHSVGAVSPFLIGYGVCDIGAVESYPKLYNATRTMNFIDSQEDLLEFLDETQSDSIRNIPINTFLIMEHFWEAEDFISEHLITGALGMGRDEFANLQPNYEDCISTFIQNLEYDYSNDIQK